MADNLGRVNPVSRHFLDRGGREEPYQGRHPKKHTGPHQDRPDLDPDDTVEDDTAENATKNHIDLRI